MDQRCSGRFLGLQWGIFFVLGEKMGQYLENIRKIPKMLGKKNIKKFQTHAAEYVICTSMQLQHFFFARIFFFWESWKKYFLTPLTSECVRRAFNPASEASQVSLFVVLFV
jgi:hypothetical protein